MLDLSFYSDPKKLDNAEKATQVNGSAMSAVVAVLFDSTAGTDQ